MYLLIHIFIYLFQYLKGKKKYKRYNLCVQNTAAIKGS